MAAPLDEGRKVYRIMKPNIAGQNHIARPPIDVRPARFDPSSGKKN
jgi:hypothetical protein